MKCRQPGRNGPRPKVTSGWENGPSRSLAAPHLRNVTSVVASHVVVPSVHDHVSVPSIRDREEATGEVGTPHHNMETREVSVLRDQPAQWHVLPKASPDGKYLAFGLMVFSGNVWMIDDFVSNE